MDRKHEKTRHEFIGKLRNYVTEHLKQNQVYGAKITMKKLAEDIGKYHRGTVYRWLRGENAMPMDVLDRMCKIFKLIDDQRNELLLLGGYINDLPLVPSESEVTPVEEVSVALPVIRVEATKPFPVEVVNTLSSEQLRVLPGNAPPRPALMVGRDKDVDAVKARLGLGSTQGGVIQVLTAMRGWPGVGKTTLASALAYDQDIAQKFPDGVLWASLGQQPQVARELATWGRLLGISDLHQEQTIDDMSARLRGVLRSQRRLLIVDDAWQAKDILPFNVGGPGCALLITTRRTEVAEAIAPTARDIYTLGVLSEADALDLLRLLAPTVVAANEQACRDLLKDIEYLPLAIQVAGRLLHAEMSRGFSVEQLLIDIRAGATLIEAKAPADRSEIAQDTTPTIAALLKKSTDLLDGQTRNYFAFLGAFAPKPATFDAKAMEAIWQVADPKPAIRKLIDHGLLEPVVQNSDRDAWLWHREDQAAPSHNPDNQIDGQPVEGMRYWMHAILVAHADSFLT